MTDERICLESPVFPIVVTVALRIMCQPSHSAVDIFPFTGEVMAVIGLRRHLWRKGVHGHSPVNRRLGAGCCEQYADEKERSRSLHPLP